MEIIKTRRSIRSYSDKDISKEDINKILHAASLAPSARNQQPWQFLVVKDKEKMLKVSNELKNISMAKDANLLIIFLTNKENLLTESMYPQDLAASVTCAMLEARALNIGSVWCGICPNQERIDIVRKIFNINNKNIEPFAVVCFGYPLDNSAFKEVDRFDENKVFYEVM